MGGVPIALAVARHRHLHLRVVFAGGVLAQKNHIKEKSS